MNINNINITDNSKKEIKNLEILKKVKESENRFINLQMNFDNVFIKTCEDWPNYDPNKKIFD